MRLAFTKMQGLGNDFVLLDARARSLALSAPQLRRLADRRLGVGCDQILVLEPAIAAGALCRYRIYNADGEEVEQCGNGARCVGLWLAQHETAHPARMCIESAAGVHELSVHTDGSVRMAMGEPQFAPATIPFTAERQALRYPLSVDGQILEIGALSMGNPHAVLTVGDVDTAPVATLGPLIERHARFVRRVNVGFMQVLDAGRIRLRVYERGVGETPACGSGACAAVAFGRIAGLLESSVAVELRGGVLHIDWDGPGNPLWMTGPAAEVFEGTIEL